MTRTSGGHTHGTRRRESRQVLLSLRRDATRLARAYRLPLQSIEAERANVKRRYGVCYDDGSIRIRLRHVRTGELLKYSSLVDTLCHELAHLRHFDHGPRFEALYRNILAYARRNGIYRPTPRGESSGSPALRRAAPGLQLHQSSILPLARLEPREPRVRRPRPAPSSLGSPGSPGSPGSTGSSGPPRGRRGGPEQLELFPERL